MSMILQAYRYCLDPTPAQLAALSRHAGAARFAFNWGLAVVRVAFGTYGPHGDRHVKLPRIGRVKVHEPMSALTRRVGDGTARLTGATVSRTAGRWFVSFTVETERDVPSGPSRRQRRTGPVGVDLGVKHLAVLSTGETVANPKHLAGSLRRLRKASRACSRSKPGSAGRGKRAARLARVHARVANQRRDGLHKLTSRLARTHSTVVVEDLNVAGMVRNRRLARAVTDTGMAQARRQLTYKTVWYGSTLHVADRWYPSSKTCSDRGTRRIAKRSERCDGSTGWRNPSLTLSDRTFVCESCGLVADRDLNASVNLRNLVAGSGPETVNARGADRKTHSGGRVAVKREPRTARAGQTGTAARQQAAAVEEFTHAH